VSDAAAHCSACTALFGEHTPLGAALKVLSLGYLLSLPALALAAAGWRILRDRLAPQDRAAAGFLALSSVFILQLLIGAGIWYGVVSGRILMTTNYFHHLMHGGWSNAITGTGLSVLGVSLLITAWGWHRAQPFTRYAGAALPDGWDPDGSWTAGAQALGLRLHPAHGVATAALTGVLQPALLVNPAYWATLSPAQRELALRHELQHLRRRDNLRKLVLEGIALLYGVLPGVRRWAADYELDSELAVDDACRQLAAETAYRLLVADAAAFVLALGPAGARAAAPGKPARRAGTGKAALRAPAGRPFSALTHAELETRLKTLAQPRRAGSRHFALLVVLACTFVSVLPAAALLSHPVSRCLLACYLGY
jgi:hypothetical protein